MEKTQYILWKSLTIWQERQTWADKRQVREIRRTIEAYPKVTQKRSVCKAQTETEQVTSVS